MTELALSLEVPEPRLDPYFEVRDALLVEYPDGTYTADITVNISRVPDDKRLLFYHLANNVLCRSVCVQDGLEFDTPRVSELTYFAGLLVGAVVLTAAVTVMITLAVT